MALLCASIAVLSLWAAIIALPAGDSLERIRQRQPVSTRNRAAAAASSHRAGQVFERGRYFSDAALAASGLPINERSAALQGSTLRTVVEQSLISSPASPHNWARRAALQLAARDIRGARTSLETSLLLGRFAPGLTIPRLRILLQFQRQSRDPIFAATIDEQIRIAARTEPDQLAQLADGGRAEGLAQRALFQDFALYQAYLHSLSVKREDERVAKAASR